MVDVYLKGADGEQNSYTGVETVSLISTDGENIETFVSERLIQKQVQADWTETDMESPAYINNKPEDELPEVDSGHDGKLLGVLNGEWTIVDAPEGAEQVQVDWNENDENSVSYIKNRPFGMGEELHELIAETALDFQFDGSYYVAYLNVTADQIGLWQDNWEVAYVGWGGNEYKCVLEVSDGFKAIGNDLFALALYADYGLAAVLTGFNSESNGIDPESLPSSIYVNVAMPVIEKIDSKYLPDDIGGVPESTSSDADKVLTVDADGAAIWKTPASGLPDVTTADEGAFLRIVNGASAWVTLTDVSIEGA